MIERVAEQNRTQAEVQTQSRKDNILIIGAGFVGTTTAIRLLHNATHPLEINLLEKDEKQRSGGLAFSDNKAGWEHYLNIHSGRISAFREEPDDFTFWANNEADRTSWPPQWRDKEFHAYTGVARRMYQQYIDDRLEQAIANAAPGVILNRIPGEAIDVVENEDGTSTTTYLTPDIDGQAKVKEFVADQTVIATGHVDFSVPEAAVDIKDDPRFVLDQYSEEGQETIKNLGKTETAFIIGTGLSAFDAVITLLAKGHEGPIIMSSRHGYTHFTYPEGHIHDILKVDRPSFLDDQEITLEGVIEGGKEEFQKIATQFREERPDIDETIYTERILKAWEPYIAEVIQRLPSHDVKELFARYRSLAVASRIGTIPEIGGTVAEAMKAHGDQPPQVEIRKGNIQEMNQSASGQGIDISIATTDSEIPTVINAGIVINTTGQEADYTKVNSPLWRNLVDTHQTSMPHRKTGRGIEVDKHGEIINANGEKTSLLAVGPMRQGDETERRGRLGAFVFSLGTLKNQAFETAMEVLQRLEDKQAGSEGMPSLQLTGYSENATTLIANEAVNLSQRSRTESERDTLQEHVGNVVDIFVAEELIAEEQVLFINKDPQQRLEFKDRVEETSTVAVDELNQAGLESELARDSIREANKQRERIALLRLTDIAYLQETQNRRGNVVRTF